MLNIFNLAADIFHKMTGLYRYFIHMAYRGTHYHGWQLQPNALTVQEVLEEALSRILRCDVKTTGCGRTDAGVHAADFYAHFDISVPVDEGKLTYKLNSYLPQDISIFEIFRVENMAHSRFSPTSRTYQYKITLAKDPFLTDLAWYCHFPLSLEKMQKGAAIIMEYDNFACFSKKDTDIKGTHCRMFKSEWQKIESELIYTVSANRFLRNMVRAIVGTLVEMGKGKLDEEGLRQVIASGDRCEAGESVPPEGLYLKKVVYPDEIMFTNIVNP